MGNSIKIVGDKNDALYGLYVWELPGGNLIQDEDGNTLSITSSFGDVVRMSRLASAARACGYNEGKPKYMPGARKVSDEEYENQKDRLENGLIPDEYDISAYTESFDAKRKNVGY